MTYAPSDLMAVRTWLLARFDINKGLTRSTDLDPAEVGIVGDSAHKASGGYHCGNSWLADVGRLNSDYSKRESSRDRPGSNAASALDIGDFDVTVNGRRHTLKALSGAIADACRRGDPRTRDIREIIYSTDGRTVKRWDRLGIRATGGSDHTWHTHISFHRDSEGRRDRDDNFLGLLKAIVDGTPATTTSTPTLGDDMPIVFLVRLAGNATVRLCRDFMDHRVITSEKALTTVQSALKSNSLGSAVWEWPDTPEYRELLGVNIDSIDDPDSAAVSLTDEQLTALGFQIRQGVPSLDQIRGVVDAELDEQSRSGADVDA